jgi:hypothetical protein
VAKRTEHSNVKENILACKCKLNVKKRMDRAYVDEVRANHRSIKIVENSGDREDG